MNKVMTVPLQYCTCPYDTIEQLKLVNEYAKQGDASIAWLARAELSQAMYGKGPNGHYYEAYPHYAESGSVN